MNSTEVLIGEYAIPWGKSITCELIAHVCTYTHTKFDVVLLIIMTVINANIY